MTYKTKNLVLGAATLLCASALAACSDTTETVTSEGADQTSVVVTQTETATETQAAPPEQHTEQPAQPSDPELAELPELKDAITHVDVGDRVTVMGEPATICVYGDGFGTNAWAANDNTSCEFAKAVVHDLTYDLNPTEDNVRDDLQGQVKVHSPVTGGEYFMDCVNADPYVRCTGGNNAAVYLY